MTQPPQIEGLERMRRYVLALPQQLRAGRALSGLAEVLPLASPPPQVVFCGMGGSAVAGSLLPLLWLGRPLPWYVHRDEGLPPWAGPRTLVIASSYSGNTYETLAAVEEARRLGCPLVAVTSGGRLGAEAASAGYPAVILPGGHPPRTAFGASFAALLHVLHRLGLARDPAADLDACAAHLERATLAELATGPAAPEAAGTLAADLAGRFVMIYTSGAEAHAAGQRLKTQLNENAKAPAAVAQFPELAHNDIVGWELDEPRRRGFALILLVGGDQTAYARQLTAATKEMIGPQFAAVHEIRAAGPDPLARVMGLIQFGDFLSVELARRYGVDPIPITRIDALKRRLAEE